MFSQNYACPEHGSSIDELTPRMFSFNNPLGAVKSARAWHFYASGLGPHSSQQKAVYSRGRHQSQRVVLCARFHQRDVLQGFGRKIWFTLDTKIKDISKEGIHALLYGTNGEKLNMTRETDRGTGRYVNDFEGIVNNLERRFRETNSQWMKDEISGFMTGVNCPDCHGDRLKPTVLGVTVGGVNISDFTKMSVREELAFLNSLELTQREHMMRTAF